MRVQILFRDTCISNEIENEYNVVDTDVVTFMDSEDKLTPISFFKKEAAKIKKMGLRFKDTTEASLLSGKITGGIDLKRSVIEFKSLKEIFCFSEKIRALKFPGCDSSVWCEFGYLRNKPTIIICFYID